MYVYVQSCSALCGLMHCSLTGSSVLGISRQEYWSGLPFPPLGYFPNSEIECMSPACIFSIVRWSLYYLSYLGSPNIIYVYIIQSAQIRKYKWKRSVYVPICMFYQ